MLVHKFKWLWSHLRSILPCKSISIVRVLNKGHIDPHQGGSICSQDLASYQGCQTKKDKSALTGKHLQDKLQKARKYILKNITLQSHIIPPETLQSI